MPVDTVNTNQHYVAQMLLQGFETAPGSEQVHVFDKQAERKFVTSIRNIAAERGFYDLGNNLTVDNHMNRADGLASGIIKKIRDRKSLNGISRDEKALLVGYVVLQFVRTRGFFEHMRHIAQSLLETIKQRGLKPPPEWEEDLNADRQREHYLREIPGHVRDLVPHLLKKDLLLFKTDRDVPFCISDNPVALSNTVNDGDGLRGVLGFAVRGIEIYLPMSAELTLAYLCPSIGAAYEFDNFSLKNVGGLFNEDAFNYLQARDVGTAMKLKRDNVRFQNSLQIRNAERFVIGCKDDFDDARDMISRFPSTRFGPRVIAN